MSVLYIRLSFVLLNIVYIFYFYNFDLISFDCNLDLILIFIQVVYFVME